MSDTTHWPFVPLWLVPIHPDVLIEYRDGYYFAHTAFLAKDGVMCGACRTARCASWLEAFTALNEQYPGARRPSQSNHGRFWIEGRELDASTYGQ